MNRLNSEHLELVESGRSRAGRPGIRGPDAARRPPGLEPVAHDRGLTSTPPSGPRSVTLRRHRRGGPTEPAADAAEPQNVVQAPDGSAQSIGATHQAVPGAQSPGPGLQRGKDSGRTGCGRRAAPTTRPRSCFRSPHLSAGDDGRGGGRQLIHIDPIGSEDRRPSPRPDPDRPQQFALGLDRSQPVFSAMRREHGGAAGTTCRFGHNLAGVPSVARRVHVS